MAWWKRTQPQTLPELPNSPVEYPAGISVLTTEGNRYFINKDGKKYRIVTEAVYISWSFPICVITTEVAVSKYPTAVTKLGFRDGSLLTNIADGKMYLVSNNSMRHITSPAVLDRLRLTRDRFVEVSDAEINLMEKGEDIY